MYANGAAPLSALVHLGGNLYLAPGTNAAWQAMVTAGRDKYGVTLRITPAFSDWDGANGYRTLAQQREYLRRLGPSSMIIVGRSSHGDGRGIDVYNWRSLAVDEKQAWSRFVALCRLFGFQTLYIVSEPWHIHYAGNPWSAPAPAGAGSVTTTQEPEREDFMKILGNETGSQRFVDEFGADDIGKYFFVPNGPDGSPSWVDNIHAAWAVASEPEAAPGWRFELARHIADARWAEKRGQIVTDTVTALSPLLQAIGQQIAGLQPDAIHALITDGLKGVVVTTTPLSEADVARMAEANAVATREKFRSDPQI